MKNHRGRFNRLITIARPSVASTNNWNEETAGAPTETQAWAMVKPAPGTERFANAENAVNAPTRFIFRWRPFLVQYTDKIIHEGRSWDIKSIEEIGHRELIQVLAVSTDHIELPLPTNEVLPAISGAPVVGEELLASTGTWGGLPTTFAYQWMRDGVAIPGATTSLYTLQMADGETDITVQVTATNFNGEASAISEAVVPAYPPPIITSDFVNGSYQIYGESATYNDLWVRAAWAQESDWVISPGVGYQSPSRSGFIGLNPAPPLMSQITEEGGFTVVLEYYSHRAADGSKLGAFGFDFHDTEWDTDWGYWHTAGGRLQLYDYGAIDFRPANPPNGLTRIAIRCSPAGLALSRFGQPVETTAAPMDLSGQMLLDIYPQYQGSGDAPDAECIWHSVQIYNRPLTDEEMMAASTLPSLVPVAISDFAAGNYSIGGEAKVLGDLWEQAVSTHWAEFDPANVVAGQGLVGSNNDSGPAATPELVGAVNDFAAGVAVVIEFAATTMGYCWFVFNDGIDLWSFNYGTCFGSYPAFDDYPGSIGVNLPQIPLDGTFHKLAIFISHDNVSYSVDGAPAVPVGDPADYNPGTFFMDVFTDNSCVLKSMYFYGPEAAYRLQELSTPLALIDFKSGLYQINGEAKALAGVCDIDPAKVVAGQGAVAVKAGGAGNVQTFFNLSDEIAALIAAGNRVDIVLREAGATTVNATRFSPRCALELTTEPEFNYGSIITMRRLADGKVRSNIRQYGYILPNWDMDYDLSEDTDLANWTGNYWMVFDPDGPTSFDQSRLVSDTPTGYHADVPYDSASVYLVAGSDGGADGLAVAGTAIIERISVWRAE